MGDFSQSVAAAIELIRHADAALLRTVGLSFGVSGLACGFAGASVCSAVPGSRWRAFPAIGCWCCC